MKNWNWITSWRYFVLSLLFQGLGWFLWGFAYPPAGAIASFTLSLVLWIWHVVSNLVAHLRK